MKKVTIIDYGLSNLLSVQHAFAHFGAETLVTGKAEDVLAALNPFAVLARPAVPKRPERSRREAAVRAAVVPAEAPSGLLELLSVSGVALDEVVRASGQTAAAVQAALADLEIEGQVVRLAGGRVARVA